jgi:hypothetical protein
MRGAPAPNGVRLAVCVAGLNCALSTLAGTWNQESEELGGNGHVERDWLNLRAIARTAGVIGAAVPLGPSPPQADARHLIALRWGARLCASTDGCSCSAA